MPDFREYPAFSAALSSLRETSRDDHDGAAVFMSDSLAEVINFDTVKDRYIQPLGLREPPKSNDALTVYGGEWLFIEFKNGDMKRERYGVGRKIYDSLLIFLDIVGKGISYTRAHMDYILVYNEGKNPPKPEERPVAEDQAAVVSDSPARTEIAQRVFALGKRPFVRFGLDRFRGYCFRNVYTYTEAEFARIFPPPAKSPSPAPEV